MAHSQTHHSYGIPVAIVIAGILVAGAVFWSGGSSADSNANTASAGHPSSGFRLPSGTDHMRGNPDAKVALIEFSDLECPFCAQLHPTLKRIVKERDDVKWVFRHFPLTSIHSRAFDAAVASECVAKLGGNEAFWNFTDAMFANQRNLGDSLYAETAASLGIDAVAFSSCVKDSGVAQAVREDSDEAVQSGGRGTPFVVVLTASGTLAPFSGALPYEEIKRLVDQALVN